MVFSGYFFIFAATIKRNYEFTERYHGRHKNRHES